MLKSKRVIIYTQLVNMSLQLEMNLEQFLPAYTYIGTKKDDTLFSYYSDKVPEGYDEEFPISTFLKREFHESQVPVSEPPRIPGAKFKPMAHQNFISRFMSPYTPYDKMLLFHQVGVGKCLGKDTKIIMYDGTVKNVQDVKVGDKLMGDDSTPRTVLSLARGREEMFKINQKGEGDDYIVNRGHILSLKQPAEHSEPVDVYLEDFLDFSESEQNEYMGFRVGVDFVGSYVTCPYNIGLNTSKRDKEGSLSEHIPFEYKVNTSANRLDLLAGILDNVGRVVADHYEVSIHSKQLVEDILFVARSLGYKSRIIGEGNIYTLSIIGDKLHKIPCKSLIITIKTLPTNNHLTGSIEAISIGEGDYYGFCIDGNRRFLLGDFTVTHNTCSAALISELAQEQNPQLLQTLFLVKNEVMQKNIIEEIATVCTGGKYKPDDIDPKTGRKISEETYVRRLNKNIAQSYQLDTFVKFAKELEANDDEYIREVYSNRVIIIDEAHNIHVQPKETTVNVYNQIFRLLHLVYNCKIILMTATPMRDRPVEIATLLNLLLPDTPNRQFDVNTFTKTYFDGSSFKDSMREDFKRRVGKGIVSFVRAMSSSVKRIYGGEVITSYLNSTAKGMKKTPLNEVIMSDLQTDSYTEAYYTDMSSARPVNDIKESDADDAEEKGETEEKKKTGLYQYSRRASMFVAPDGTYADDMVPKWVIPPAEEMERKEARGKSPKKSKNRSPAKTKGKSFKPAKKMRKPRQSVDSRLTHVSDKLRNFIYNGNDTATNEDKLKQLEKLSCKFAGVIRAIISNPTEKAFVYSNIVSDSGTNLFAAIMELFDFNHVALPEDKNNKISNFAKPNQYLLITGNFPTSKQANFLVNKVYNDPDNLYGSHIRVIIASKIVGEGSSFKQTRQFHNLTPGWNETETTQAEGRILRAFAHDIFPENERYIKLYRWCAMPDDRAVPSIDFEMYKLSEDKDRPIKQIERLLKEISVDCALNVKRNMTPSVDKNNSKECDYDNCIYQCEGIPESWYGESLEIPVDPIPSLIDDSYNLLYADATIQDIQERIVKLFQVKFMYDFFELSSLFPGTTTIILVRALKGMIDKSIPIINRYGIPSYIRENSNLYFLVDNHEFRHTSNLFLLATYSANPVLKADLSFSDYVKLFEIKYIEDKLTKLPTIANRETLAASLYSLSLDVQEYLLESFLIADEEDIDTNRQLREAVLNIYKGSYTELSGGVIISTLLREEHDITKCYDPTTSKWAQCSLEQLAEYSTQASEVKSTMSANPYGYYGLINSKGKFKIVTVRTDVKAAISTGKIDKRVVRDKGEGQVCGTGRAFSAVKLIGMLLRFGEIAEANGVNSPSISSLLSAKDKARARQLVSADSVWKLYLLKLSKLPKNNTEEYPIVTKDVVDSFSNDKLLRWYEILKLGSAKKFCAILREWFEDNNLLMIK